MICKEVSMNADSKSIMWATSNNAVNYEWGGFNNSMKGQGRRHGGDQI